ncbi:MAG TPA: WGR domain-containing protein, partial [Hydrogenophaga sp.]
MRRFELVEGTSSKFWEIESVAGGELNIRWGRIGTAGQSQTKSFGDSAKAKVAMDKLIKEKTGKGYAEVGVVAGAAIGRTEAAPNLTVALPPKVAAAEAAAAPADNLDAQCERVFEAVRSKLAQGQLVLGEKLSVGQLKRQFGVSDQGAAMAFERLKDSGMLHGWGATAQVQDGAQALAQEWTARAATLRDAGVPGADAHGPLDAAAKTAEGECGGEATPPWMAQEVPPLRLNEARRLAYASRQYPAPVAALSVKETWQRVRSQVEASVAMDASEEALRATLQRMLDRLTEDEPAADAQADSLLLALALSTTGYYGESAPAKAIVDYLVARYGLPGAVDVFLAAQQIQVETNYNAAHKERQSSFSSAAYEPLSNGWRGPFGQGDEALRMHLAAAPQDQWDVCAAAIEAALPGIHPTRRPTLAMLLPERPALSNALVRELTDQKDVPDSAHWLMLTATDGALAAASKVKPGYSSGFWGDERMVATALLERGLAAVEVLERGAALDPAGEALSCIGTPEAVAALARVASNSKGALARLALSVDRWPQAALVALARVVAQGGKEAGLLTPSLTRLLRAYPHFVDPLRPWLDNSAQAAVDRQLALLAGPVEVADPDDLPLLLVVPPWRAKVQKKVQQVLSLSPLALSPVEQWGEGAREAALDISSWEKARHDRARANLPDLLYLMGFEANSWYGLRDAQQKALWEKSVQEAREVVTDALRRGDGQLVATTWRHVHELRRQLGYSWYAFNGDAATLLPRAVGLAFWNSVAGEAETRDVAFVMASLGLDALPGLVSVVRSRPTDNLSVACHFGAVELAPAAA